MPNIISHQLIEIENTTRYYCIPIKMGKIKTSDNIKCWQRCGANGCLLYTSDAADETSTV